MSALSVFILEGEPGHSKAGRSLQQRAIEAGQGQTGADRQVEVAGIVGVE